MLGTIIALVAITVSAIANGAITPFSYGPTPVRANEYAAAEQIAVASAAIHADLEREAAPPRVALAVPGSVTRYMPVADVRLADVDDSWRASRGTRTHEGQDILAPEGTRVYASAPGTVMQVGVDHLGGNVVSIWGDDGYEYYYAHLKSFAAGLSVGDRVTHTSLVGYVGSTGNADSAEPHLHFGVYAPHGAIDPLPLLKDRF
jgi:murein DD-endopeptidase MepM/ murein hydrolase activator NlpD